MRFLKIVMLILALAVVVKLALYYGGGYFRPVPALAANIKNGDELTRRVLQRFPIGSSATALKTELEKESGWGPVIKDNHGEQFVSFTRRVGLLTTEFTIIIWKADSDDRLIEVRANILRDSAVP
jgi:hypothetical protein